MSKSKGSQTSTTTVKLPAWLDSASQSYLNQAKQTSASLTGPYQGDVYANMNDVQRAALDRMNGLSNFSLNGDTIGAQMNPYIQNVEQAALAQGQKALAQNLNGIADAGIRSGAAFGSRQGVLEGAAVAQNAQDQAALSAQLRQQGYQNAVQNALAGQQAALGAAQAGYTAGSAYQNDAQKELAAQEAQYNALRQYPLEKLNIMGSALGAVPYGTTSTSSQPTSSNPLMGAMGGALAFASGGMSPWLGGGMGLLAGLSDATMKTDIKKIGKDKETGLTMYSYRYKGDPKTYPKMVGPMAQEIEKKYPDQVKEVAGKKTVGMSFLMGKVKT